MTAIRQSYPVTDLLCGGTLRETGANGRPKDAQHPKWKSLMEIKQPREAVFSSDVPRSQVEVAARGRQQ